MSRLPTPALLLLCAVLAAGAMPAPIADSGASARAVVTERVQRRTPLVQLSLRPALLALMDDETLVDAPVTDNGNGSGNGNGPSDRTSGGNPGRGRPTTTTAPPRQTTTTVVGDDDRVSTTTTSVERDSATTTTRQTTTTTTTTTTTAADRGRVLLDWDVDSLAAGGFGSISRNDLEASLGYKVRHAIGLSEVEVVDSGGDRQLRVRYTPSSRGSEIVQFPIDALDGAEELWLSYDMMFEPGWESVKGGKLPGLGGGSMPTGGDGATGTDGFSARLMWAPDEALTVYAYHPDRPKQYGEGFRLDGNRPVGRWFTVTQRIRMNSGPDAYDGEVEMWIDGVQVLDKGGLRWRTTGDFNVDGFLFSTFYGGNSSDWAPSTTTYARFDDFLISTSPHVGG